MGKLLATIGLLAAIGTGVWFLTGFDKSWSGESKRDHHLTRALRTVAVVFLCLTLIWLVESPPGPVGGPLLVVIPLSIALVLRSSLSEVFAHFFVGMVDPAMRDNRAFDPKKSQRYQDTIGHLIRTGQHAEAIKLCEELKRTGEVELTTLEHTLAYLGVPQDRTPAARPLVEAGRLRAQGKLAEAEASLKALLNENPADEGAALMLMRLYAQDLRQPDRAWQVCSALARQPHVSTAHLEFARRSMAEWSQPPATAPKTRARPQPESVDEMLAQKAFGTAVEKLEEQIKAQPGDFQLQLKLAEVYAVHCGNFPRAEKIVRQLERSPAFRPEQVAQALTRLQEWRPAAESRRGAA